MCDIDFRLCRLRDVPTVLISTSDSTSDWLGCFGIAHVRYRLPIVPFAHCFDCPNCAIVSMFQFARSCFRKRASVREIVLDRGCFGYSSVRVLDAGVIMFWYCCSHQEH